VSALSVLDAQKSQQSGGCFKIIFSGHFQCGKSIDGWMQAMHQVEIVGAMDHGVEQSKGAIVGSGRNRNMQWIRK